MKNQRELAYETLYQILYQHQYSNLALKTLKENTPFVTQVVYGTLRNYYLLEHIILNKCSRKPQGHIMAILLGAGYELLLLDSADYGCVNEAVECSKKYAQGSSAGFVNALLRSLKKEDLQVDDPLLRTSHPQWLYDLWCAHYGKETALAIMEEDLKENPTSVRINQALISEAELLKDPNFRCGSVPQGYFYQGNILKAEAYLNNQVIIQSQSSMLAVQKLDVKKDQKILDVCAAPGSKTIQMALAVENSGTVVANDLYPFRTELIGQAAQRYGCTNIVLSSQDGTKLYESYEAESFDRILLDAPCSGLGTLKHKPEIKITLTPRDLDDCARLQKELLMANADLLKKGGKLVYSTCTLNRKENEKQIEAFLKARPDYQLLEMQTIFPYETCSDGFFVALMERL